MQYYLVIVAILYDDQDHVVNFADYYEADLREVAGNQALDFKLCVDPRNQNVARYELRTWGL